MGGYFMNEKSGHGWEIFFAEQEKISENYPLPAYSEFMPPPKIGITPYGTVSGNIFEESDPYGWHISEMEEEYELKPGLRHIGKQILSQLINLGSGKPAYHIAGHGNQNLENNPYWPEELAKAAGKLPHERYIVFLPLALSRTQDDKGRVSWTLFGSSEQGPERAFWKSFYISPEKEILEKEAFTPLINILNTAYGKDIKDEKELKKNGFRILPSSADETIPELFGEFVIDDADEIENLTYLLTFRPFARLPQSIKEKYLSGKLALLPFPGSLVFWGTQSYSSLNRYLPFAHHIPLFRLVARRCGTEGLRVPQSGWIHEATENAKHPKHLQKELLLDSYHRTNRWNRMHRHMDELSVKQSCDKITKVLFSTDLESMGLYNKPMARNCQLWNKDYELVLNGPVATRQEIFNAEKTILGGGLYGYKFVFPAMKVASHEVYWQRPLAACLADKTDSIEIFPELLSGYLTAYDPGKIDLSNPVELWPRFRRREEYLTAIHDFADSNDHYSRQTALNIITLLDVYAAQGNKKISHSFARHLLRIPKTETLEQWLEALPNHSAYAEASIKLRGKLKSIISGNQIDFTPETALTYSFTANSRFEYALWDDIKYLAHGSYKNKSNADCIKDAVTASETPHHHRDLEALGDYLMARHRNAIEKAGMRGKAFCTEIPFKWKTDFIYDKFGGWQKNQSEETMERDILVIIPGKDRSRTVIMADHYDTSYMEDIYDKSRGGSGARLAANGADDNHSATATLLQAAPVFLELSNSGALEHDIWLLHLTGEEFPSDCMGARYFCKAMIEKKLKVKLEEDENETDLSDVKITGTFVLDMIAHNRNSALDIFQISPGKTAESLALAYEAHCANMIWNSATAFWNSGSERRNLKRAERVKDLSEKPQQFAHLPLAGEVRTQDDPHSSIYNTDGQIFSDSGIPVVLFMENYDLNRSGYHDTKDTMENIDLDYASALAAIAIETVARIASVPQSS